MAKTATPYGLKAVNHVGGTPYAGSTRLLPIASGYASNLFNGQVVQVGTGGTIELVTTFGDGVIGVFVGCTYTDPGTSQLTFRQYWPASTAASDAKAYVVDDPNALFKIAVVSSGTTMTALGYTVIGTNMALVQNAGDTTTGTDSARIGPRTVWSDSGR